MGNSDNLTDVLDRAIRNRMAELQTAMPAKVVKYDFQTQKAVVQPTINRRYADGRIGAYPVINNVPVVFPRSGGASMTFPVKSGDTVLLIFAARSIDTWAQRGGMVDQDDTRMHSINDAIAIPGLIPFSTGSSAKNNTSVLLTYRGAEVELKQSGEIKLTSPIKVSMEAPLTYIDSQEVYITGDLVVKNDIYDRDKASGSSNDQLVKYNSHTHDENGGRTDEPNLQYQWWKKWI